MKNKLLTLIGGTAIAALLLAGCGAGDNMDPAPENDVDINDPAGDLDDDNGAGTQGLDRRNNNGLFNNDNDNLFDNDNNNGRPGTYNRGRNDVNTDEDMDMMRDRNTPGEEGLMEDDRDLNDRNNRDR